MSTPDLSGVTQIEREIIRMLAECSLNMEWTARRMQLHRNTVAYHVKKIEASTGYNPLDFYGMQQLLRADAESPESTCNRVREAATIREAKKR